MIHCAVLGLAGGDGTWLLAEACISNERRLQMWTPSPYPVLKPWPGTVNLWKWQTFLSQSGKAVLHPRELMSCGLQDWKQKCWQKHCKLRPHPVNSCGQVLITAALVLEKHGLLSLPYHMGYGVLLSTVAPQGVWTVDAEQKRRHFNLWANDSMAKLLGYHFDFKEDEWDACICFNQVVF